MPPRVGDEGTPRPAAARRVMLKCRGMVVQALYALQNGFLGFERSGLFFGEFSGERVQIPIACWLIRAADAILLFDTGLSPRAVPGLMRNDPMARFTTSDLLANRLDALGLEPDNVDLVVISHLHYDRAGHPRRRLLLLAGAHRQGTGARRRLEPDPGTPLDQEAEDDRPPDGCADLPGSRPELLGDGQAVPGRVPLVVTRRGAGARRFVK